MTTRSRQRRVVGLALGAAVAAAVALSVSAAPPATTPRVFPPGSKPHGLTYGEWSARWWQWAFSIPVSVNPLIDETGANADQGQSGPVYFLAGGSGATVRDIRVPAGKALFFPIIDVECSTLEPPPFNGTNEAELSACAALIDPVTDLACEIDSVSVSHLSIYRVQSPLFSIGPLPADNLLGVPEGSVGQSVSDGYFIMLAPLSAGTHTIHFTGTFPEFGSFSVGVAYNLTVTP